MDEGETMQVTVMREAGLEEALLGLSLSYNCPPGHDMLKVAHKLAGKDGGHNKFLESIVVWLEVDAPREWWQQMDTYRIDVTKQSESTMHTLTKRPLDPGDFAPGVDPRVIEIVNEYIERRDWRGAKRNLPEGFLQRRQIRTSYKTLRHIIAQRAGHRLPEWREFCQAVLTQLKYPEWVRCASFEPA